MLPRFGHHSSITSSDGAAASIFNSQWDIPLQTGISILPGGGGPRVAIANLTAPRARFFLWRRKPVPSVERRVYLGEIDGLDPRGDYWISFAVPGSDYYDLHRGQFFPFFAQIKDELNLMTVAELQEKTQALRMTNPELFERPEPIVKKRFGSGGDNKTAVVADVLGFSALVSANPHARTHFHLEDPELGHTELTGTSESHNALVMLFWNLHRELFASDEANGNPTYSHVASDSMLLIHDDFSRAINTAARVLCWSLLHSEYSLRIGVGCGTFNTIQDERLQDGHFLKSTTVALFYGYGASRGVSSGEETGQGTRPVHRAIRDLRAGAPKRFPRAYEVRSCRSIQERGSRGQLPCRRRSV